MYTSLLLRDQIHQREVAEQAYHQILRLPKVVLLRQLLLIPAEILVSFLLIGQKVKFCHHRI